MAQAQSIRIVRSDVDSGRSNFVTATQLFGMDIEVSGVNNCTGVSFELQYQGSQYVVFSNWKARDLGLNGTFAYDLSDTSKGLGSLHVGALSGVSISDPGVDNPVAVHLDFVVRPNTPNNLPISFSFVHAQAVSSDSGGRIVSLSSTAYTVNVHGFVNVYPGDADNNGVVDSRDATTVGAYLKQGSGASNVRGYKREPCSTLWMAQEALVWDSSKATYADCDGSGDVTLSDNLVVQINFGKVHSKTKHEVDIQSTGRDYWPATFSRQALGIYAPKSLLGAAFELRFAANAELPLGFECADPDVHCSLFLPDPEQRSVFLVFGSENGKNLIRSGQVGNFIYASSSASFSTIQAMGATADGGIFNLGGLSSVDENPNTNSPVLYIDESSTIHIAAGEVAQVCVSDILGRIFILAQRSGAAASSISTQDLPQGSYFVLLQGAQGSIFKSFQILR